MWRTPPCTRACKLCKSFMDAFVEAIYGSHHVHFLFSSYLGKIPILTHIFQMGWFNHHNYSFFFPMSTGGTWRIRKSAKDSTWEFNFYTKSNPPQSLTPKNMDLKTPNPKAIPQKPQTSRMEIVIDHFRPGKKKTNLPEVGVGDDKT